MPMPHCAKSRRRRFSSKVRGLGVLDFGGGSQATTAGAMLPLGSLVGM